jgi:hypothetical protein
MLSASVDRALVQAAAEVVVLADHTKLGTDTMFQTVPTDVITRLVTDEPPVHDDRAHSELQALADQGVQIAVAGATGSQGGDDVTARRGGSLPGRSRGQGLRSAAAVLGGEQGAERERARVADLRRR